MSTTTPEKTKSRKPVGKAKIEEENTAITDVVEEESKKESSEEEALEKTRQEEADEASAALEALDPSTDSRRWVIGKSPQDGGTEDQYSVYVQRPLAWMPQKRFFSLVAKTMSMAIKESGGALGGMEDVFGAGGGTIIERGRRLTQRDFQDASSFFSLAMDLVGYSPDFLIECYVLWLDVPRNERTWAKQVLDMPYSPEDDKWGLKDGEHMVMIQTFIDQNYEDIRRFFAEELPAMAKRVALHEKAKIRKETTTKGQE